MRCDLEALLAVGSRRSAVGLTVLCVAGSEGRAQSPLAMRPEWRAVAFASEERHDVHLGGGVNVPLGWYARLGVFGGAGFGARDVVNGTESGVSGHLETSVRLTLDPFRQHRWGVSAGGGLLLRADAARLRPDLTILVDVEPPAKGAWQPAIHAGIGGGLRLGLSLRGRSRPGAR